MPIGDPRRPVSVKFTDEEYAVIDRESKRHRVRVGPFIRAAALAISRMRAKEREALLGKLLEERRRDQIRP